MSEGDSQARAQFTQAAVARLSTVSAEAVPHLVPVVFAAAGDTVYTAVDGKPKSGAKLRRLRNIEANPKVSLLVDEYADNWDALWWVRADGHAVVHHAGAVVDAGFELLRAKYPQYETVSLDGPIIAITVHRWAWWHGRSSTPTPR